jgi:hypothetical protein
MFLFLSESEIVLNTPLLYGTCHTGEIDVGGVKGRTKNIWKEGNRDLTTYSLRSLFVVTIDFLFIFDHLFYSKIIVQIYKIICCVWTLFSDKTNHNKIYNNF